MSTVKITKTIGGAISGANDVFEFYNWVTSAISSLKSHWNGIEKEKLQGDILQLKSDFQCLSDTLPATYKLIDRAEWKIHDHCVADILSKLKDAVYDAEDLLGKFSWHELKETVEGKGNASKVDILTDFFNSVTQGSFNEVTDIQNRLINLSDQLKELGLHQATPRFDESLRPETTSFPTEANVFGRDSEIKELIRLLNVTPKSSKRTKSEVVAHTNSRYPSRRKTSRTGDGSSTSIPAIDNNKETKTSVPVLPIVGIGGVGKTTLAQKIYSHPQVKSHFDLTIWICISDDFDVKRLTEEVIERSPGKTPMEDNNLNSLQAHLVDNLSKTRFLLVLDDMWNENEECWKRFYAPFQNVHCQGSMMLVTTRSQKVADIVGTLDSFPLEGLKDGVYWKFFKLCVFGSDSSNRDPELKRIGKEIVPKLRGSPLAAKTLGRLLGISRDTTHWNNILTSDLWEHDQEGTEILPALRLSYMYLPFHLKRCFSFCAVYPKDHNFQKARLAEMWVAEGFVPKGNIPLGSQYFEDLVNRSFFQKHRGAYVIHDLMHDMAQLVSKDECFIVKNPSDIEKVPENVRHLSILSITNVKSSDLSSLGNKCTKLRTLLCNKPLSSDILSSTMGHWFDKLLRLRVIFCVSTQKLPESIGNLMHLRYFEISRTCNLKKLPSSFCSLYNLQIFYAMRCNIEELPRGINKLINLQKFESHRTHHMKVDAADWEEQIRFINKFYKDTRVLTIYNLGAISKDRAVEMKFWKMDHLNCLILRWSPSTCQEHKATEVFEALQPNPTIKSVHLDGYPGKYLPSWFDGRDGRVGAIWESLTELIIEGCQNLSSLEQFLQPTYVPYLEELNVRMCPNITHLLAPYLKKLYLKNSGTLGGNIKCSSLSIFNLSCDHLATIELQKWSLPVLQKLKISHCESLTFIGESEPISTDISLGYARARRFPLLTHLNIEYCDRLESLDNLLTQCLPAIESITIESCALLRSLPTGRVGSFSSLKSLKIIECPRLHWQSGTVLPPSLQTLTLRILVAAFGAVISHHCRS